MGKPDALSRWAQIQARRQRQPDAPHPITMPLHGYVDIFSGTAFDMLPQHQKWDHAIELECKPYPGFRKVYLMTLTEQKEMDTDNLYTRQTLE
jgi:hypothetical protein